MDDPKKHRPAPVILRSVPYADLEALSELVARYSGSYALAASSAGVAGVNAICSIPDANQKPAFKGEWEWIEETRARRRKGLVRALDLQDREKEE